MPPGSSYLGVIQPAQFSPDAQNVLRKLSVTRNSHSVRKQASCKETKGLHKSDGQTMRTNTRVFLLCSCLGVSVSSTALKQPHPARQRGQPLSSTLAVDDLYALYHQARTEYQARLSKKTTGWRKVVETKSNITVSLLNHPDDPNCPYVKMEMEVPVPVDDVVDFLSVPKWDANMPKVDQYYEGLTVHKSVQHKGADIAVCHRRMKRLGGLFGKRDFAFVSVSEEEGPTVSSVGGTRVATTMSIVTPKIPRMPGYTRGYQDSYAIYRPVNNGKSTQITTVFRFDLNDSSEGGDGGYVPMVLYAKAIGRISAQSCDLMRRILSKEARRQ